MIGAVTAHHAAMPVRFRLPDQPDFLLESVIDTGFAGYLTLPLAAILAMGLQFNRRMPANLADDSTIIVEVYVASIVWNENVREVEVLATGQRPLIGTLLLDGCELDIQFVEGGAVSIEEI
jgi:clan AA aspartic protease